MAFVGMETGDERLPEQLAGCQVHAAYVQLSVVGLIMRYILNSSLAKYSAYIHSISTYWTTSDELEGPCFSDLDMYVPIVSIIGYTFTALVLSYLEDSPLTTTLSSLGF
jgi:hypothetical protein